jgi:hypothetical protein
MHLKILSGGSPSDLGGIRRARTPVHNDPRGEIMNLTECFKRTAQLAITEVCREGWVVQVLHGF